MEEGVKEKKKCPSKPRGVRWILHLDMFLWGLIQFGHIQAENEMISIVATLGIGGGVAAFRRKLRREVSQHTQLMKMMWHSSLLLMQGRVEHQKPSDVLKISLVLILKISSSYKSIDGVSVAEAASWEIILKSETVFCTFWFLDILLDKMNF